VQIASVAKAPVHFSFFQLPAAIEVGHKTGRGPGIPEAYTQDYYRAIARLMENANRFQHEPWDQSMFLSVAAAQAVVKGHIDVAEALLNLDADWIAKINNREFD
jgi:hypothetical protein